MKKGSLFIIIISLVVYVSFGAAAVSEAKDKMSQRDRQMLEEFQQSLKNSAEGRFQTVRVDDKSIMIIDSKLGHLWVFLMSQEPLIKYAGQLYPDDRFWKTIHKIK